MKPFIDEIYVTLRSGRGGAGAVSFRREKYVPRGGPDGGDGGRGGDVVVVRSDMLRTLSHLAGRNVIAAEAGHPGAGACRHGRSGEPARIEVPPGTVVRDAHTGEVLADLTRADEAKILVGGRGGKGNVNFKSARRQAPRYAQPGQPGQECRAKIELSLIADVGLVGRPNAGKSSLLSALSNARPTVAEYPFTTREPNLGVLRRDGADLVIADVPGIIEGAHEGRGLGFKFLKHVTRTAVLLILVDLSEGNPVDTVETVLAEVREFDRSIAEKPKLVVGNKLDILGSEDELRKLTVAYPKDTVVGISVATRQGIPELIRELFAYRAGIEEGPGDANTAEPEVREGAGWRWEVAQGTRPSAGSSSGADIGSGEKSEGYSPEGHSTGEPS